MTSTYTSNLNLEQQGVGDNAGTWGEPHLNQNVIAPIDAAMGAVLTVPLTSSDVTLTLTQWQCRMISLTGAISANVNLIFPLSPNSVGSATAVGGERVIDNQCTGNFTVTVKTAATGSTGVVVVQGVKSTVVSDTVSVSLSDSRTGTPDIARIPSVAGSPVGVVTGVAGTQFKPSSMVYDRTNNQLYFCTADGSSGWSVPQVGFVTQPQGYLTPVSGTAVITSDSIAATSVYYTPYVGNAIPIYNGAFMQSYPFAELTLTLTSAQAASQIYDVFGFIDAGVAVIGTGPAWTTATAGSGSRGSGAGTTQLTRINGVLVNAVSITARNGASSYTVAASQGTYLGSLSMDATNGQVSCTRSFGQSRKWGIWNAYNRVPVILRCGDSTSSWSYNVVTVRPSDNSAANSLSVFCGLAEEQVNTTFSQKWSVPLTTTSATAYIGIGLNSTTAASGLVGQFGGVDVTVFVTGTVMAHLVQSPSLGINTLTALESGGIAGGPTFYGTETNMLLSAAWRA